MLATPKLRSKVVTHNPTAVRVLGPKKMKECPKKYPGHSTNLRPPGAYVTFQQIQQNSRKLRLDSFTNTLVGNERRHLTPGMISTKTGHFLELHLF